MRTTYILDTSALIQDPFAYKHFSHGDVVIPIAVLNELDKLKKQVGDVGKNARVAIRALDEVSAQGDISTGVLIEDDVLVIVDPIYYDISGEYAGLGDPSYGDTQILACAIKKFKEHLNQDVMLVSNDINLRVKAKARALQAISHEQHKYSLSDLYGGVETVKNEEVGLELQKKGYINPREHEVWLLPNECVSFEDLEGNTVALGRRVSNDKIKLIKKHYPWNVAPRNKEQSFAMDLIMDKNVDLVTLIGRAGSGKAQPLDSQVLTPDGFKRMGDLKVGNLVSTPDGGSAPIIGIFPQGEKDIYKISFSDGTSTECCENHLWQTKTSQERNHKKEGKVRETKDIAKTIFSRFNKKNHSIPITSPIEFSKKNLPVKPYIFGTLLENKSFRNQSKDASLWMKKSNDKFIPDIYKYSSISDRIELLQGILDTNGTISKFGNIEYYTINQHLAKDFRWLVESLGGTAKTKKLTYVKNKYKTYYKITVVLPNKITPFKLKNKINKLVSKSKHLPQRYIVDVKFVAKKQAQCILIDHPDHLYITNNCIVTHNTLVTLASALELVLNKKEYDKFVIYRPIQPVGNDIGYLPGPQPLGSKILTPNGWTTMGEIKVGDYVISQDGTPSKVLKIFPKGKKEVFKITTTDGTSTEACGDHPWAVKSLYDQKHNNDYKILSTNNIKNNIMSGKSFNYQLPRNNAVQFSKKELPIPPYSFGAYLGDGSCTDNHFTIYCNDSEIIQRVEKELSCFDLYLIQKNLSNRFYPNKQFGKDGAKFVLAKNTNNNSEIEFSSISHAAIHFKMNPSSINRLCNNGKISKGYQFKYSDKKMTSSNILISKLKDLGLYKKRAWEKHIPDIYKYSSVKDRVDLLRGLMDTDGNIKKNGECSFTTTSEKLADDIIEIVRSLGGRASKHSRNRIGKSNKINNVNITAKRISYEFTISMPQHINPFYLTRKSNRFNVNKHIKPISIKSIECIGEKEVQCILIDNPSHLYLTDDFIVTHNTLEEKLAPWFQAIMDNFEILFSTKGHGDWRKNLEMYQRKGQIEMEAITYIRGRSIPNSIILIDECQNLTKDEVKTILTRAGENTKIILTGDIEQIDNSALDATSNGLTHVIEKFKDSGMAGHITFIQGERSRLASKAAEIL